MGTLTNGNEFDNSYKRGQPASFPLNGVIKGWTEGLQLMTVGSKYKFYIPYQLGYGLNDMQAIPAGSVLIFEVELLDVKKPG
jgi:FKBP-type peptidyl-prolyl cis-trans isomerase FklB